MIPQVAAIVGLHTKAVMRTPAIVLAPFVASGMTQIAVVQAGVNPHDARESASLTRLKHLPARQCDCRRRGAADKARG